MPSCMDPGCYCNMGPRERKEVELADETKDLLDEDDHTYEDFAHRARHLLAKWLAHAEL